MAQMDKQIEILRRMTPAQKLDAIAGLYKSAFALKAAWLRKQHPGWTDQQVYEAVKEIFLSIPEG